MDYDAIVVGAGPSGSAAAYDPAAAGRRVLLLDRRHFPRVKACAGGLTVRTLRRLRYPVDPVVRQVCTEMVLANQPHASVKVGGSGVLCAMTVRSEVDHYCLERTIERGAEFRVVSHIDRIAHAHDGVRVGHRGRPLQRFVSTVLVRGYARGMSVSQISRWYPLLAFPPLPQTRS